MRLDTDPEGVHQARVATRRLRSDLRTFRPLVDPEFHSFRHTFAKRALESGAQITWLSRHLGHSSLKVTTDIYGHWERAERKLQAAKMEGAFPV